MDSDKWIEVSIQNCTYYYCHDLININDLDLRNPAVDEEIYKDIFFITLVAKHHKAKQ